MIDDKPSIRYGDGNEFDEFTALEIRPAEDEGKYDILVNMDNIHLANELRREKRTSEHPLITYYFKYGLTLVALGMLQEHRRHEKTDENNGTGTNGRHPRHRVEQERDVEDVKDHLAEINGACMGIASVIIPVIQRLSLGPANLAAEA